MNRTIILEIFSKTNQIALLLLIFFLLLQSCQELIKFCHNTYAAGPSDETGLRND
jgi:hypothetical protein